MKKGLSNILMVVAVGVLIYLLFSASTSSYSVTERSFASVGPSAGPSASGARPTCNMRAGNGLASALLPREVAASEDFGEFAPQDILKNQSFLEPRAQIGFPETVGGALRNANQQIRADPPNPRQEYTWHNSTIVPDLMQRDLV
jgi:hypothetical protein